MLDTAVKNKALYEVFIYLGPEAVNADISSVEGKIRGLLEKHGAEIKKAGKFTKTEFVYPINKNQIGYSAGFYFETEPSSLEEIGTDLKTSDINILRFMIGKAKEISQPKVRARKIVVPEIPEFDKESSRKEESEKRPKPEKAKTKEDEEKQRTTLEDIDKKLDEIMRSF